MKTTDKMKNQNLCSCVSLASSSVLALALGLLGALPSSRVNAQTFTTLYSFTAGSANSSGVFTNGDGANPYAGFTVAGNSNIRYGTTSLGGSSGNGTVFAANADGTGFRILHSFSGGDDGANPWTGLILLGNTLYGTAHYGGSAGEGTVFAVNTDGTGFTNLHTFTGGTDGANPNGGLIASGSTLYGTAAHGAFGSGTVFAINTDGTGFTNLHTFTATYLQRFYFTEYFGFYRQEYYVEILSNDDGAVPVAGLILAGNTLYGTASGGGYGGNGTVFAVNLDGTGFTTLHYFDQTQNLTRYPVGIIVFPPPFCFGGGCGPGSQCVGGFCGCQGFCFGG